jgi:hypothetical protein
MHAAVAAFAAFSFHVVTASAAAAFGHNTSSDRDTPMLLAICFFMDASLGDLQRRSATFLTGVSAVRTPELQRVPGRPGSSRNGPVDGSGESRLVGVDNLDYES